MNTSKHIGLIQKIAAALSANGIELDVESVNKKQATNEIGMETELTKGGMTKAIKETISGRQLAKLSKEDVSFEFDTYSKDGEKFPLLIANVDDCSIEFTFDHVTETVEIQVLSKQTDEDEDDDFADFREADEDGDSDEDEDEDGDDDSDEDGDEDLPLIEVKSIRAKLKKHGLAVPAKPNTDGVYVIELGDMERKEFYPIVDKVMADLGAESSKDEEKNYCYKHDGGVFAVMCKKVKGAYIASLWEKQDFSEVVDDEEEEEKPKRHHAKEEKPAAKEGKLMPKEQKTSPAKELIAATGKALDNNQKAFELMAESAKLMNEAAKLMNQAAQHLLD